MSTFKPKYRNLVELYQQSVEKFADRPLFGTKRAGHWHWMTYKEFGAKVDVVRGALSSLGVKAGDRVAVISDNRPEWAIAAYATYGLGGSYVPMYESQHDKDWSYILKDCGAKVLIVANEKIRDRITKLRGETPELKHVVVMEGAGDDHSLSWDDLVKKGEKNAVAAEQPKGEDIAGFIYTSGTTGNPKGVLLTHTNLASNVSAMHEVFPLAEDDRSLSFLPWAHSFGQVVELHGLLSMGASMGIAEAVDKIIDNLAEVQPTLLFSVPRIFNRIYDGLHKKMAEAGGLKEKMFHATLATAMARKELEAHGRSSGWLNFKYSILDSLVGKKVRERFGGRLKYAFSGGAALSKDVAEFIDNLGITVYEGYGLTETSPIATCNWPGNRKIGSIGKPIPGVDIEIDTGVTNDPENGEIVVYGHNVMKGYHGLEEENGKVFVEKDGKRGFRTGDMGRRDDDGFVYITGRIKEQYKLLNGKYVVPSPLEEQIKLSPFIANAMVYGDNREYNVALVVPDPDTLKKWAAEQGLSGDLAALVKDKKVRQVMKEELDKVSAQFKSFERCKDFALVTEDFSTANGMLTPTLKLKRREVMKRYGDVIDALYKAAETAEEKAASQSAQIERASFAGMPVSGPMFALRRPTAERIARFIEGQRKAELAFGHVGATRDGAACPDGFVVDRNETTLGRGRAAFEAARAAVGRLAMFDLGWVQACGPDLRVEVGTVVGVLARGPGMWALNACRIVEVIDEDDGERARYGFIYVTLPGHLERGEERFEVSLEPDGVVRYRIVAVSQPAHLLARLGKPIVRREQKRFARASLARMEQAVREADAVR